MCTAKWPNNERWYEGQIRKINEDGTFDIFWPGWNNWTEDLDPRMIRLTTSASFCQRFKLPEGTKLPSSSELKVFQEQMKLSMAGMQGMLADAQRKQQEMEASGLISDALGNADGDDPDVVEVAKPGTTDDAAAMAMNPMMSMMMNPMMGMSPMMGFDPTNMTEEQQEAYKAMSSGMAAGSNMMGMPMMGGYMAAAQAGMSMESLSALATKQAADADKTDADKTEEGTTEAKPKNPLLDSAGCW